MATLVSRVTGFTVAAAVVVSGVLSGCTPRQAGPAPAAAQFLADLGRGDTGGAAARSDRPTEAHAALNEAWSRLQATKLDATILGSRFTEDTGSVNYRFTWELPKNRTWTYDGVLNMIRDEGAWRVRWTASARAWGRTRPLNCGPTRHGGRRSTSWAAPRFWSRAACTATNSTPPGPPAI
jgi:hypothetical protein